MVKEENWLEPVCVRENAEHDGCPAVRGCAGSAPC